MDCFIRDLATWAHIAQCEVIEYEVPLFSVENTTGRIRISEEHPEYSSCWVILDGNIFYGEHASPSDGYTDLTVSRPMNAFDRTLVYKQNLEYDVTTDSEMNSEKKYYEKTQTDRFFRTTDNSRDPLKSYLLKDSEGYFVDETIDTFEEGAEYFNRTSPATYIITSDRIMSPAKRYYIKVDNEYYVTTDTSFQSGTTYYEKTANAEYAVTSDSSYNSSHTYYICDYYGHYIKLNSSIFEEDGLYYESELVDQYLPTEDESFTEGKTYYELINSYGGIGTEVLETYIKNVIEDSFINEEDTMYSMPYISVEVQGDSLTVASINLIENEVYSFLDIIDLAYEKKVMFAFLMSATGILIYIFSAVPEENNVFFDDGHNFLNNSTVSNELVAKVTVRRVYEENEALWVEEEKDYYWHPGGDISTTPPNPRIKGIWDIVSVEDEDIDLIEAAKESMANNDEAIKVEFYSDKLYYLWDKITCLVNDEVITESISSCTLSHDDPRYLYTIGKMPTTLTEKFEQSNGGTSSSVIRKSSGVSQSVTYENDTESYLAKTGGSVNGNLGVQDTTSTDKLIIGSNSYGSSLPATGKTGQVFFVI